MLQINEAGEGLLLLSNLFTFLVCLFTIIFAMSDPTQIPIVVFAIFTFIKITIETVIFCVSYKDDEPRPETKHIQIHPTQIVKV